MKKRSVKKKSEIGEILEIVNFIKDRMATKDELRDFRNESNEHFFEINGQLVSIEQELKDIKRRLTVLEDRFDRFAEMNKVEIEALWKRVIAIEKRLKMHS